MRQVPVERQDLSLKHNQVCSITTEEWLSYELISRALTWLETANCHLGLVLAKRLSM